MFKLFINPKHKISHINPELQGHFSEHLGRCIYEGIYVGENSDIPNVNGMRTDVVEALKEIRVPTLVLAGEKDLVLEQETRHIAHVIPGARMKILPEESHGSYIIHNRKIARLILDFCSDR